MFLFSFTLPLFLFLQLRILGAFEQDWSVTYQQDAICALKGSTVLMHSTYKYPPFFRDVKKFWVKNAYEYQEEADLREDPDYLGRIQYFDDNMEKFSLKLENVTERDEHMYSLKFSIDPPRYRYFKHLRYSGVRLRVTDLRVDVPELVLEGHATLLTCRTTCNLTNAAAFLWYKNGRRIETTNEGRNILSLQPTRTDDAGSYSCAANESEHLFSPAVTVMVRYPPKNMSVSISPSVETVKGGSVTLTCNSDANPPVENYTWFRKRTLFGKGQTLTISNFSSDDAGEYKCKSSNAEGHMYSAGVILNVIEDYSFTVYVAVGVTVIGLAALLTAVFWSRRQKKKSDEQDYQNVDPHTKDDTYTALQPSTRSSDDVYHTLAAVHSSSPDDTYTALDPQSRSPEYETLAVPHFKLCKAQL